MTHHADNVPEPVEPIVPRCQECGCQVGAGTYCYQHAPYTVWPLKDGSFRSERFGLKHLWLVEPPSWDEQKISDAVAAERARLRQQIEALEHFKTCPRCKDDQIVPVASNMLPWLCLACGHEFVKPGAWVEVAALRALLDEET